MEEIYTLNIGVIGYGTRINAIVKLLVNSGEARLAAIMDVNPDAVKEKYIVPNSFENVTYYTNAEEMLENEKLDGVLVGTRCSLHTHYALLVAKYNIPFFLQKSTHDLDYINYLLGGLKPVRVCAMESKQIYKGNKPAGLKCADRDERETCRESDINVKKLNDGRRIGEYCCFAVDTGNHDSGTVIVEYENGLHTVYSQNFVVRNGAGKRGAIGYDATLEFDWKSSTVTIYNHFDKTTDVKIFESTDGHGGGDELLSDDFISVMKGEVKSHSPLLEGILSAEMCLAAKKSAEEKVFVNID